MRSGPASGARRHEHLRSRGLDDEVARLVAGRRQQVRRLHRARTQDHARQPPAARPKPEPRAPFPGRAETEGVRDARPLGHRVERPRSARPAAPGAGSAPAAAAPGRCRARRAGTRRCRPSHWMCAPTKRGGQHVQVLLHDVRVRRGRRPQQHLEPSCARDVRDRDVLCQVQRVIQPHVDHGARRGSGPTAPPSQPRPAPAGAVLRSDPHAVERRRHRALPPRRASSADELTAMRPNPKPHRARLPSPSIARWRAAARQVAELAAADDEAETERFELGQPARDHVAPTR